MSSAKFQYPSVSKGITENVWYYWILLIIIGPIIGTFFPPESYFSTQVGGFGTSSEHSVVQPFVQPVLLITALILIGRIIINENINFDFFSILYIIICLISLLQSKDPGIAINRFYRLLPLVGFSIAIAQFRSRDEVDRMIAIAFGVSALISLFMAVAFPSLGLSYLTGRDGAAWRGALNNKNVMTVYAIGVVFCINVAINQRALRAFSSFSTALCIFLVIMSRSSTAMLVTIFAILVYGSALTLCKARRAQKIMLSLFAFAATALITVVANAFSDTLLGTVGRDATLTGRTEIWQPVWQLIMAKPISGYGYGFWAVDSAARDQVMQAAGFFVIHSHNSWLDIWLQTGIFGVAVIALAWLVSVARSIKLLFGPDGRDAIVPLTLMLMFMLQSISEVELSDPGTSGVFWFFWAATSLKMLARRRPQRASGPGYPVMAKGPVRKIDLTRI